MKRIYYLSTCKTCQRILHDLKPGKEFEFIDIKETPMDINTLDILKDKIGSYEALFSRKALLYRKLKLHYANLQEEDFKKYMLMHYTFLKRPFIIVNEHIVAGTNRDAIQKAKQILAKNS